jgi:hypothetical protein
MAVRFQVIQKHLDDTNKLLGSKFVLKNFPVMGTNKKGEEVEVSRQVWVDDSDGGKVSAVYSTIKEMHNWLHGFSAGVTALLDRFENRLDTEDDTTVEGLIELESTKELPTA